VYFAVTSTHRQIYLGKGARPKGPNRTISATVVNGNLRYELIPPPLHYPMAYPLPPTSLPYFLYQGNSISIYPQQKYLRHSLCHFLFLLNISSAFDMMLIL